MAKLRIGFIGAGGIAIGHYQRLQKMRTAGVAAITEPADASLERFYKHCPGAEKLPVYGDYAEMLKKEELDGVVVLSPHTLHYEQINTSLNKGLHVLTEKPMVCTIRHAKALIRKAKQKDRVLMISYQRHYEPAFRYMRDSIRKGAIGEIEFVQAVLSQEWLRAVRNTWRQKKALSGGGQLNDSGSHMIDIIMWVTGLKVKEVFAWGDNFDTEVDINSALNLKFTNGALGNMSIIGNAPSWYEDHTIAGSKGAFYMRQGIGLVQQDATGQPVKFSLPKQSGGPDSNFVKSILGKETPDTPPECGLRTIEVTEAAWKSMESGNVARVP
jgi:predicted dehydrogenase